MAFFSALFIALLLTVVTIPPLTLLAKRINLVDLPDARKTHTTPIPRCGGLAMAFGALTPTYYWFGDTPFIFAFLIAASCIVFFGVADDFFTLSPRWKFLGQLVAALIVIYYGDVRIEHLGILQPEETKLPAIFSVPLTLLVLVGVTNAVNLCDGLDGLAGGISLMNICIIGYLAILIGHYPIALAALALAGAIFGFLRFNTHPASIFMGDSGSQLLGFSSITFTLVITQHGSAINPLLPLLLFGLPVLDTLIVMTTRIKRGCSPFSPDKCHFHHRLLNIGLGHAEAVVAIYLLQATMVLLAFFSRFQSGALQLSIFLLFATALLFFLYSARKDGWQKKRWRVLDRAKCLLISIKGQRRMLAFVFPGFQYLLYGLIIATTSLVQPGTISYTYGFLLLGGIILLVQLIRPTALGLPLRAIYFFLMPLAVYTGDSQTARLLGHYGETLFNSLFVVLFMASILVSFFSTRKKGIWSTPLDFLILLLMLIVPNLAGLSFHRQHLGIIGLKCLVLIISFEVLLAEKRGDYKAVALTLVFSLFVYAMRFFL